MSLPAAALTFWLGVSSPCAALDVFQSFRAHSTCDEAISRAETRLGAPLVTPNDEIGEQRCAFLAEQLLAGCKLSALPPAKPIQGASAAVAAIFARPEFAQARAPAGGPWELLVERFLSWLFRAGQSGSAQHYAFTTRYLVLFLATGVALWGLGRAAVRGLRSKRPRPAARVSKLEELPREPPPEHLSRARALLNSEPRASMRESLLALLSLLEARSWARPDRVTTNHELAQALEARGMPAVLRARVSPLLTSYDQTYYSLRHVEPSRAEAFLQDVSRLQTDLERQG